MKIVHEFGDVAVLTNKQVTNTEGPLVWFTDGSSANLESRECINRGQGDIRFTFLPEYALATGNFSRTLEYPSADRLVVDGGDIYLDLHHSDVVGARVVLVGTSSFHDQTDVSDLGDGIAVRFRGEHEQTTMFVNGRRVGKPVEGRIEIHAPRCTSLSIACRGAGIARIHIPVEHLTVNIRGALDLDCDEVSRADVQVQGSGDVRLSEVREQCHVRISGSGSVELIANELPSLSALVSGSGSILASASVRQARLEQTGSGSILVAHVIEHSSEIQRGSGSIRVLKRGI